MATRSYLGIEDFQRISNITVPKTLSPVLDIVVPRSQAWLLEHNSPIELTIFGEETLECANTGEDTLTILTPTMPLEQIPLQSMIQVYDTIAKKHLTVTSVDWEAQEVTVSDATSGNKVKVFFPLRDGTVQIAIQAPMGMGSLRLPLLNRSLKGLHGINQQLATSPIQLRQAPETAGGQFGGWVIPESFRIQVLVDSQYPVTTDTHAFGYHINIPYRFASWSQMPAGTKDAVMAQMVTMGGR